MCNASYLKYMTAFPLTEVDLFCNPLRLCFFFFSGSKEEFIQIHFPYLVPNLKGRNLHILFYGLLKKYVFV